MASRFRDLPLGDGRIGLGLAALGRPGYITVGHGEDFAGHIDVESMEGNAHVVLDAAFAAGVRYFDAARSYGMAEAFLGSWLEQRVHEPEDLTVGSKWGYTYTAGGTSMLRCTRSRTSRCGTSSASTTRRVSC